MRIWRRRAGAWFSPHSAKSMSKENEFFAHSANRSGRREPLREHLVAVAGRASKYAAVFGASDEARFAGLLHDLGKYGELFQRRLRGEVGGIDHWTPGAVAALHEGRAAGVPSAVAIQGHHVGLQKADANTLRRLMSDLGVAASALNLRLSEQDRLSLLQKLRSDGVELTPPLRTLTGDPRGGKAFSLDFAIRLLYSALVDADFVCTEAHFEDSTPEKLGRDVAPDLQPGPLLEVLSRFIDEQSTRSMTPEVRRLRASLREECTRAASRPIGLFTLTGPTGSGKTLASLEFALRHALLHCHRRIVIVLPYLSLIDQTVSVIRSLLAFAGAPYDDPRYLIEHHSLANGCDARSLGANAAIGNEQPEDAQRLRGLLSENWDAPIVVTTTVQFFESLFSNRSSACRKLHRLAGSVILLDEVQTLPARLAVPTLAALSCLTAPPFKATAALMTATQPAFAHLSPKVAELCGRPWAPDEIVSNPPHLFSQIRRTAFVWPKEGQSTSWRELAAEVDSFRPRQALVVVNLKRHAQTLLQLMPESQGVLHLSTTLCPAHRRSILDQVRSRLGQREECVLISTQCVEAGVDLDFPRLYRALGPLEAIAQAAGRCNRNGGPVPGTVTVFRPEPDSRKQFPDPTYAQAAFVTESLLREHGGTLDPSMPEIFEQYYSLIYNLSSHGGMDPELQGAINARDFVEVARLYRLIPDRSVNVLVPWDKEQFERLAREARNSGIHRGWIQRARAHAVGLFTANAEALQGSLLEPVPLRAYSRGRTMAADWFLLLDSSCYDEKLGLVIPPEMETLNV